MKLFTLIFSLAVLFTSVPSGNLFAADERPNVVIILADDMGYGDAGCYNSQSKCSTPNIDGLAASGMRFTDAHAAGAWCTPSRYGLLTGRYAFRTSLAWRDQAVIAEGVHTIGDMLRKAGYATALVGKWHLGFDGGPKRDLRKALTGGPCDRGFDEYFGLPASLDIPDYYWIRNRRVTKPPTIPIADSVSPGWSSIQANFYRGGLRGEDFDMGRVLDRIGDEAVERIKKFTATDKRFLLYVPLTSPHTPWLPGKDFEKNNAAGMYSQFVSHTDNVVGRITRSLSAAGVADETLVIFASDNGPVWYAFDTERFGHDSMGGLRGMKGDVWEAGHRIPFVVRWPGRVPAGSMSDQLVSFVDIAATVANATGSKLPKSAVDSVSFESAWKKDTSAPIRTELVAFQEPIVLRQGPWKLIQHAGSAGFLSHDPAKPFLTDDELNPESNASGAEGQLYNLATDPKETNNLWGDQPERVRRMQERLKQLAEH